MAVRLNKPALEHARSLVRAGKVVKDERDDWSEDAPSASDENTFVEKHGWTDYSHWHLGIDEDESKETKGRYSFPFGDFAKVHRCAVISLESCAAQFDHDEIASAAKALLELIDS
ncbi:MAG: hypothetical protein BGO97_09640 [Micrococcales bacterium 70-64]|nr:hypothetical protein [Leifsonia sp.]ODU64264.1 MAG: hypothetical protein ABT06_09645 [Leifsonia sp. SCN 70-46]OJX85955.1 MAG: hypothetical protein BGO97_09640 [Micrococcales bacterium 70-64]